MSELSSIKVNSLNVDVKKSDRYTNLIQIKLVKDIQPENIQSGFDIFVSHRDLETLGMFLLTEAKKLEE